MHIESSTTLENCDFKRNLIFCNKNDNGNCFGGAIYISSPSIIVRKFQFIENDIHKIVEDYFYYGGAISSYCSNTTVDQCIFINNKAQKSGAIDFSTDNRVFLTINMCLFKLTYNVPKMYSIFWFSCLWANTINNITFTFNQIHFTNTTKTIVFENTYDVSGIISNNCIYPYDKNLYKNYCSIYHQTTNKIIAFDQEFNSICLQLLPTSVFTKSSTFSQSSLFSKSSVFTFSQEFSQSKPFTESQEFSKSKPFTESQELSQPKPFTKSQAFQKPGKSNYISHFEISIFFTKTDFFSQIKSYKEKEFYSRSAISLPEEINVPKFTTFSEQPLKNDEEKKFKTIIIVITICASF